MLADSARIQEEDAAVAARRRPAGRPRRACTPARTPSAPSSQCVVVPYETPLAIAAGVRLRFLDAGHILGSAMARIDRSRGRRDVSRITFTGDLGRRGLPFLREPSAVPSADLLICESTYGGRVHEAWTSMAAQMGEVVRRTLARGGKVLVPAFSLGRTQIVVHYLAALDARWPAAAAAALRGQSAGRRHRGGVRSLCRLHSSGADDAGLPPVTYVRTAEESKDLSRKSGAVHRGRLRRHVRRRPDHAYLRQHIDDPRTTIVLVSYQAPDTLGRQAAGEAADGALPRPELEQVGRGDRANGFSGHADKTTSWRSRRFGRRDAAGAVGPWRAGAVCGPGATLRERGFADVEAPHLEETAEVA